MNLVFASRLRSQRVALACVILAFVLSVAHLSAQTINSNTTGWPANSKATYDISAFGDPNSNERNNAKAAFDAWSTAAVCGITFAETDNASSALAVLPGPAKGQPALTKYIGNDNQILSSAITLIDINNSGGGPFFDKTQSTYGAAILGMMLHEIGHTMGLGDEPFDKSKQCGKVDPFV